MTAAFGNFEGSLVEKQSFRWSENVARLTVVLSLRPHLGQYVSKHSRKLGIKTLTWCFWAMSHETFVLKQYPLSAVPGVSISMGMAPNYFQIGWSSKKWPSILSLWRFVFSSAWQCLDASQLNGRTFWDDHPYGSMVFIPQKGLSTGPGVDRIAKNELFGGHNLCWFVDSGRITIYSPWMIKLIWRG